VEIVFFFQSTNQSSWRSKLAGVYRFAREHDWFIHVIERSASTSEIRQAFRDWQPIGCLVDRALGIGNAPDDLLKTVPTVFLDDTTDEEHRRHPCLLHDSAAEATLAGCELLKLKCRSYAYLGTGKRFSWDNQRLERFRRDVHAAGMKTHELPRKNLQAALKQLPMPCGILAANDLCAIEVYHAAIAAGLKIPDDIAVVGIDNDEMLCESVSPGLTSAEPDFEGAGYRLAKMLASEIELARRGRKRRGKPPLEHYGPVRIVRRGSTAARSPASPRVRRALEFIRLHACEPALSIDDVAAEMGCSRRLATLRFRAETGRSILDTILDRRVDRACELLTKTVLPIETITVHCGYASSSFFKRQFRARAGMTMREWRKTNGGKG